MNCVDWVHHDSVTTANPKYPVTIVERIERKKPTNADRIRAMTDEELAEFMCHNISNGTVNCAFCAAAEFCRMGHNGWLDWLRQEAEQCAK